MTDLFFSFSLPEGTLTTYDTYPERCLPDGRVRMLEHVTFFRRLIFSSAARLVVRDPHRVAQRHLSKPGSPYAKDGPLAPTNAAWNR
jgi:hypothetical protein